MVPQKVQSANIASARQPLRVRPLTLGCWFLGRVSEYVSGHASKLQARTYARNDAKHTSCSARDRWCV
jgi:hypothetical protein